MMAHPRLKHLENAGEMGRLVSNFDWSSTSLGDPEQWPSSLVTSLGIVLENKIAMYIVWGENHIQFYNDAYIRILGNKHPAALGNNPAVTWKEVYSTVRSLLDEVFAGKTVHFTDMPLVVNMNNQPKQCYYTFSYGPIRLEDGSVGGVLDTVIDTTDEVTARNLLQQSERIFRKYQELSPIPFLSLTEDWIIDYINPSSLKEGGIIKEEIVGKKFWDAFPNATHFQKQYEKSMKGESVFFEEHYSLNNTWYRIFSYPLSPGVGVIFEDITESKRLQNDLRAAVEARDRFLSIASHELNTPLASMKLHTQMMLRMLDHGIAEERLQKFFVQTDLQITQLSRLIEDMLDVSRIREGKLSLNYKTGDIKKLLTDIIERFSPTSNTWDSPPPKLSFIGNNFVGELDFHRFEQVVSNLLVNAYKHGKGKDVFVNLCDENSKIVLIVEDHGQGVPKEDQAHLFDQFFRGKNPAGEGLGLGLFITNQIVMAHRGNITLKSELGKGSIFRVELPKFRS